MISATWYEVKWGGQSTNFIGKAGVQATADIYLRNSGDGGFVNVRVQLRNAVDGSSVGESGPIWLGTNGTDVLSIPVTLPSSGGRYDTYIEVWVSGNGSDWTLRSSGNGGYGVEIAASALDIWLGGLSYPWPDDADEPLNGPFNPGAAVLVNLGGRNTGWEAAQYSARLWAGSSNGPYIPWMQSSAGLCRVQEGQQFNWKFSAPTVPGVYDVRVAVSGNGVAIKEALYPGALTVLGVPPAAYGFIFLSVHAL